MTIQAIETIYKGYRFRSRLEARWAVFFDALGIKWEYEKEGYNLDSYWYLPDFWILHSIDELAKMGWGFHGEIKPTKANPNELIKMVKLVELSHHNGLIFQGVPWPDEYTITKISGVHSDPFVTMGMVFHYSDGIIDLVCNQKENYFSSFPVVFGDCKDLDEAFYRARAARFEHGEHGRIEYERTLADVTI